MSVSHCNVTQNLSPRSLQSSLWYDLITCGDVGVGQAQRYRQCLYADTQTPYDYHGEQGLFNFNFEFIFTDSSTFFIRYVVL